MVDSHLSAAGLQVAACPVTGWSGHAGCGLAELKAQTIECRPYDAKRFSSAVHSIRELTVTEPAVFVERMVTLCRESGVAVALVPEIQGAKICGAATWLTHQRR